MRPQQLLPEAMRHRIIRHLGDAEGLAEKDRKRASRQRVRMAGAVDQETLGRFKAVAAADARLVTSPLARGGARSVAGTGEYGGAVHGSIVTG